MPARPLANNWTQGITMKALTDITLDYLQPNPKERKKELDGYFTEPKEHAADWEVKEFRLSNDRLYSILQKCYATALEMMGAKPSREKMKESIRDYWESKGYNLQDSSPWTKKSRQHRRHSAFCQVPFGFGCCNGKKD
ncbi:MAG: hypothetical protein RLZZ627_1994 [Pseudomonadota bacterium]